MARIIFKGETAPVVRFGIRQHSDGQVKAASPCCNRSMKGMSLTCSGCRKTWEGDEPRGSWNLLTPITVVAHSGSYEWLREWAAAITRHDGITFEVRL